MQRAVAWASRTSSSTWMRGGRLLRLSSCCSWIVRLGQRRHARRRAARRAQVTRRVRQRRAARRASWARGARWHGRAGRACAGKGRVRGHSRKEGEGRKEKEGEKEKNKRKKGRRKRKEKGREGKERKRKKGGAGGIRGGDSGWTSTRAGRRRAAHCAERGKERDGTAIEFGCRDGENFWEGIRRIRGSVGKKGFRNDWSSTMKMKF